MNLLNILIVLQLLVLHEIGNACNSYHGGYGLFGDDYGHGHSHVHMNHGHGYFNQYGHNGYHGTGGLMDSYLRTDIGGSHSHGHHSHHHRRTPLIPISHHRHVHRVHRRSVHSHRSPTIST